HHMFIMDTLITRTTCPPISMLSFFSLLRPRPRITLFPYTTLFRSTQKSSPAAATVSKMPATAWKRSTPFARPPSSVHRTVKVTRDRKSTRLNSSHVKISYAVFCLKKKIQLHCELFDDGLRDSKKCA